MTTAIYWFRNDLRLNDNLAFTKVCKAADFVLPIYIDNTTIAVDTPPSYPQISKSRRAFLYESLQDLTNKLKGLGSNLLVFQDDYRQVFPILREHLNSNIVYCEQIEAHEELDQVAWLNEAGFSIKSFWQSSMLDPRSLPFELEDMPGVFTQFRLKVEKHKLKFASPLDTPLKISSLPPLSGTLKQSINLDAPLCEKSFYGGESKGLAHIEQYFERRLVDKYKRTRNELIGIDYSSKFSPWLALGCCSPRTIAKKLAEYEHQFGSNEGTYWLWFELLWRDYFRFLSFKNENIPSPHSYSSEVLRDELDRDFQSMKFKRWSAGCTADSFVDAGIRELLSTGYLSNRMRQVVASYWIYNLEGNWAAGAAWFCSQLLDYDVYSNQGNWQYIAGKGADHQGGRPFNIAKQTQDHDPEGIYRKIWST